MPTASGEKLGPYQILDRIGEGGMGEVFKARDTRLDRIVALKRAHQQFTERFDKEARAVAALNHPNICQLYDVGPDYLVMEYVDGPTLADRIAKGTIPLADALPIARQIAEALEAAHRRGIIHRDLKPANVKITPEGVVKLLDFGLARAAEPETPNAGTADTIAAGNSPTRLAASVPGMIMGTAGYMAPEQARGHVVDKRADIWAFGVVLYEMLTGKPVFGGETLTDTLAHVILKDPDWSKLPPLPAPIDKLLKRCLDRDLRRRLQDIAEARIAIEDHLANPALAPEPATIARRQFPALLLGGTSAAMGTLGFFAGRASHTSAEPAPRRSVRFTVSTGPVRITGVPRLFPTQPYVAFRGQTENTSGIFVSRFDGTDTRLVSGTEPGVFTALGGAYLVSPDGEWLIFARGPQLWKVSVRGSEPTLLGEVFGGFVGEWYDQSRLLGTKITGEIEVLSIENGQRQTLIQVPAPFKISHYVNPQVLPHGEILYARLNQSTTELVAQRPGSSELKVLLKGDNFARYLESGHLLTSTDAYQVTPFDVRTLSCTGPSVAVPFNPPVGRRLDVNREGTLVTVSNESQAPAVQPSLRVEIRSPQGKILQSIPLQSNHQQLEASPDGRTLLLGRTGNTGDIWSYDLARETHSRVISAPFEQEHPVWSPDSMRFAYTSTNAVGLRSALIASLDGSSSEKPLWAENLHYHIWDWSPDGRTLVLSSIASNADLLLLPADGNGKPTPFFTSEDQESQAVFSPDGRWLAYLAVAKGEAQVFVRRFPDASARQQISVQGGRCPRWAADGSQLFYLSQARMFAVSFQSRDGAAGRPRELFALDSNPENSVQANASRSFDILPDGRFIILEGATSLASAVATKYTVTVNWFDELRRLAPVTR